MKSALALLIPRSFPHCMIYIALLEQYFDVVKFAVARQRTAKCGLMRVLYCAF